MLNCGKDWSSVPKDKKLIRQGDYVKIINPEIVLRWGYSLTKEIVKDKMISNEQKRAVQDLVEQFRGRSLGSQFYQLDSGYVDVSYEKILDELAFVILKREGFGGKQRKLFTETKESLRNALGYVNHTKIVRTGEYYPPTSYQGYFDAFPEYEPGGLKNAKTHVLCKLSVFDGQPGVCAHINENGGVWIDRVNLAKDEQRESW